MGSHIDVKTGRAIYPHPTTICFGQSSALYRERRVLGALVRRAHAIFSSSAPVRIHAAALRFTKPDHKSLNSLPSGTSSPIANNSMLRKHGSCLPFSTSDT